MSISEMRGFFDILQDKYNTPYFTDDEKDEFLEDSMWNIINLAVTTLEEDNSSIERVRTLITPATASTDSNGLLSLASSTSVALLTLSLASTGVPLHRLKHSTLAKAEDNTYKKGTTAYPNFTAVVGGYQTYPTLATTSLTYIYLKVPTAIDDLPVAIHRKQVAGALTKTGFVTDSQALTMIDGVTNG